MSNDKKIKVLMVGVDKTSIGGMRTVAEKYIQSELYNQHCDLTYISTATRRNKIIKILFFLVKLPLIFLKMVVEKYDIVHIHMAEKTSVRRKEIIIELAKAFGCKTVVHMHAGPFMEWYRSITASEQRKIKKTFEKVDSFFVLGEFWKQQISEIIDYDKINVLYNGVDCPKRNRYNSLATDIAFIAHLRKEKGIYEFLEAVKRIENELPSNTMVHLCGTSDQFNINEYLECNGLCERVVFHGWLNHKEIEDMYPLIAINVLPTHIEGLSMSVLESMAEGIPMVTTNITTMPELLGDIVDLISIGDVEALSKCILDLINNREKRIEISELEYKKVCTYFTTENMINNTLRFYGMLL